MKKVIVIIVVLIIVVNVTGMCEGSHASEKKDNGVKYENHTYQYSKANLNIRKLPNTKEDVLKVIKPNGKIITYDSIVNGFVMVLDDTGREFGWAYIKYLQKTPLDRKQFSILREKGKEQIIVKKNKQAKEVFRTNPLGIDKKAVKNLEYNTVPFDKWDEWGSPKTLEGTNNTYWVVLLPKSNICFVAKKKNNFIIFADFGKEKAISFIKKRKKQDREKRTEEAGHNKWYVGGTLHNTKIAEWKKASFKNKMATCADFMTIVDSEISLNELKARAMELKICIDKATIGLRSTNNMNVAEVAASCIMLLGYKN